MLKRIAMATALAFLPALATAQDVTTVSHGYSNFGELKYGPDEPFSYVNLDAPKGGEISFSSIGTFDGFNASTRKGVAERTGDSLLYESLMVSAADDPYAIYCNLCTTIEYPDDLAWVVMTLRDDVRFADGSPMTAEDLKFTIDLYLEQGIAEFRDVFSRYYDSVEVIDPRHIKFNFNESTPNRDRMGLVGFWNVFSKAWFETAGARLDETSTVPFLSTGPYTLGPLDMGRSVVYQKNPDWWGRDLPINRGRFNFDSVRVEYFGDSSAAMEGFKAGEYTFRVENSAKEWATSYDFPAVQQGYVVRETPPDGSITSAQGFVFNLKRDVWKDHRIRDAVNMMFNFEWSNETLFYGYYERPSSFWGNSDLEATGVPEGEEAALLQPLVEEGLLDAEILTEQAAMPFTNDAAQNQPSRGVRRAALKLMNEAGYTAGADGLLRNADGKTLDLTIIQRDPTFDRIVNPYLENLRDIGVNARLDRIDSSQYIERRRSGNWDLTNHILGQDFEPSLGLKQYFSSETAEDSSRNLMALRDPAVDRLIDGVVAASTLDELRPRVHALDRVLRAYGFWIPQWGNKENWLAFWDQYRHPETLPPLAVGILDFWWYDEEAAAKLRQEGAL